MTKSVNFAWLCVALSLALTPWIGLADRGAERKVHAFIEQNCLDCHDADAKKGGLDLSALKFDLASPKDFTTWVNVHDRVASGEMPPPKKKKRPEPGDLAAFTNTLETSLTTVEREKDVREGRATERRLNRYEYEETLRDLLSLPYLEVKDFLPEDSVAYGFNKVGDALDVSHVQMARYLSAADFALRKTIAPRDAKPEHTTKKYYAWDQGEFFGSILQEGPKERRTFPLVGFILQTNLMAMKSPKRTNEPTAERREREGMGVVVSTYEPTEIRFGKFRAPVSGRYRLRFSAYSFWIDPKFTNATVGRRDEPVTIYSDTSPRILRKLGSFDVGPAPTVREIDTYLLAGETIRPDAARLHRSRPPDHKNPLTVADGMPGVAFQWMEVEGPLIDEWPPKGHKLLFGDLPRTEHSVTNTFGRRKVTTVVTVDSSNPERDAEKLLRPFMERAYRYPVPSADVDRFLGVIKGALKNGYSFTDSMIAGYTAVLSSPAFLYFHEPKPGHLDDRALAERLSYFLWNTCPDAELRDLADKRKLHRPDILRSQTERMLTDPKSRQFINAFLDYWLDLRVIAATAPDAELYPDYQLDDLLVESMSDETQLFFAELVKRNLGVTNLVASDFAMLNERLATLYGIENVNGVEVRPVSLTADSIRGGLLTQASVLKVTANGTTTSPVKRGAWIMSRIIGRPPPPPPASVPAVEPDIRGATTIREQLAKHRTLETCNACHRNIDPAGFALESFDVMGAWRDRYRAVGDIKPVKGIGHNGIYYHFGLGPSVDSSGELPDGRKFDDVRQLKQCLAHDDAQLARNLARQLIVYSTGAPIRFSDRPELAKILNKNRSEGYAVRSLIHDIVQSDLFLNK
jgi:mono/diheme cytochrome c family protein